MSIYDLINKKKKKQKAKMVKTAALTAALGVTAGATAGVLFAPKSGKETRENIANKSSETKDKLVEKTKATKAAISKKVSEGKKDVSTAKEKISEVYLAAVKDVQEKISEYLASKKGQKQEACDVVEELALADTEVDEEITEEELTEEV